MKKKQQRLDLAGRDARLADFDGAVAALERIARKHEGKREIGPAPKRKSDTWFARRILFDIESVRAALRSGSGSCAAAEALDLGLLAAAWPAAQKSLAAAERARNGKTERRQPREEWIVGHARRLGALDRPPRLSIEGLRRKLGQLPLDERLRYFGTSRDSVGDGDSAAPPPSKTTLRRLLKNAAPF
jgi:hypothetical protein